MAPHFLPSSLGDLSCLLHPERQAGVMASLSLILPCGFYSSFGRTRRADFGASSNHEIWGDSFASENLKCLWRLPELLAGEAGWEGAEQGVSSWVGEKDSHVFFLAPGHRHTPWS